MAGIKDTLIFLAKYLVLPALGMLAAYQANDPDLKLVPSWLKNRKKPIRVVLLILAGVTVTIQGVVAWTDEQSAKRDREDLQVRIDDMKERVLLTDEQLEDARKALGDVRADLDANRQDLAGARDELCRTRDELARANTSLATQARSIGSLVFNLGTSIEGKRRFVQCFRDLSRLTGVRGKPIVYEGLVCEDGVAIFGFEQEPEGLREFFFFTEAEINHVLSGTQFRDRIVSKGNEVCVGSDSEWALIDELIRTKSPMDSDDAIEHERALSKIDDMMRTVFRYVYRSCGTNFGWWRNATTKAPVSRRITFAYAADPLAETPRLLSVELEIPCAELKAYYGVSVGDFNARLIAACSARGIEPKVRAKDIRGLNGRVRIKEDQRTFPYQK